LLVAKGNIFCEHISIFFIGKLLLLGNKKKISATHGNDLGEKWLSKSPQNNAPKLPDFKEQFQKLPYLDTSLQQIAKI